jgi:hypothetical protein
MALMRGLVEVETDAAIAPRHAIVSGWTFRGGLGLALAFSACFWLIVGALFILR